MIGVYQSAVEISLLMRDYRWDLAFQLQQAVLVSMVNLSQEESRIIMMMVLAALVLVVLLGVVLF